MQYHQYMPTIQVRDVPESLYRKLTEQAKRERRSLSQQVIVTLERGADATSESKLRRQEALARIRERGPIAIPDPVALIREDRNR
jgi:hypothetical protein